ncbi:glycoside hydrolase family 3 N-terminal domain-containing protein [Microbacterium sp. NPDC089318]
MTTADPVLEVHLDATADLDDRVEALLAKLSTAEKAGQLTQLFYMGIAMNIPADFDFDSVPDEQRAFLEQPFMVQSAIRAGTAGAVLFAKDPAVINALQRIAAEESPHGIPLLVGYDVIHGMRTIFPVPVAMAASWDPEVARSAQQVAAREARAVGINWTFAPVLDIARDPRWGRIVEGAGEDPVLASAFAAAQVRGLQGDLGPESILATPKHFAGYGAGRGGRDYDDVELSDSELWNVYLPPFQAAVDAGAASVMSAYMDLNGVPATANRWLLTDVLRGHMGFDGFVVSDANSVRSLETQHFAEDLRDSAARALDAGLDMEMAMFDPAFARLPDAVDEDPALRERLDEAVRRVLRAKFRLGLFENPYVDEDRADAVLTDATARDDARAAAERTFVLLKNDASTLPLRADALRSIAVIGELADSRRDVLGPWVFDHDTAEAVSILDGLRGRLGDSVRIEHTPGAHIPGRVIPSPFDRMDPTVPTTAADHDDDVEIARAVELAAAADVAIVVVGQRQNQSGERASQPHLDLPGRQLEQLHRISETGTPVILVVMSGRPLDLRWADEHVPAILQVWHPGIRGGDAVAATLVGDSSPAGRLPFTWPRHVGQVPIISAHQRTHMPQEQDERYMDEPSSPLYPFGHGLSYTRFSYGPLAVDRDALPLGESVEVSVEVTNDGDRDGDEVVQLYVHQRHGTSSRPVRQLAGFERIRIPAGESRTVRFPLGPDQLSYWSAATRSVVQDRTTLDIWVGGSSTATAHAELAVIDPR